MSSDAERWLPVVGHEGFYEVSDMGRVRSLDRPMRGCNGSTRQLRGRVLRPNIVLGYPVCHLSAKGAVKARRVHHMVLEAFVGARPPGTEGCHGDGNPGNGALWNLRWDTPVNNAQDSLRHGTNARARRTHCPRGHEHSEINCMKSQAKIGKRSCLACSRALALISRRPELADHVQAVADDYHRKIMEGAPRGQ